MKIDRHMQKGLDKDDAIKVAGEESSESNFED